jgi:hypothetical protein
MGFSLFVPVRLVQQYRIKFYISKNQQYAPVKVHRFTAFFSTKAAVIV